LTDWLNVVEVKDATTRAIIAPHAGYRYSGPSAAYAYKSLVTAAPQVKRIVLLGPSHHHPFSKCGLSKLTTWQTPLGDLRIDTKFTEELYKAGDFVYLDRAVEEAEHSLEMHLPYIVHAMAGHEYQLVPVMVGSISSSQAQQYGQLLGQRLVADPHLFVIASSDFCHWGERFGYTPHDESQPIWQYIDALDHDGMKAIESGDADSFHSYLKKTKNTICGRNPIQILMHAITYHNKHTAASTSASGSTGAHHKNNNNNATTAHETKDETEPALVTRFVHSAQSSQCVGAEDSSVSYASALIAHTHSE
jgi:AmmeMemoRadiSam system protein B